MTTTLYLATERGVSIIRGEGVRWEGITCLRQSKVECVLADPRDGNVAYCGTLGEGLFKTTDGGASWTACTSQPESKITALAADRAGLIYAGSEPSSVIRSADGGATWERLAPLSVLPGSQRWSFPPRPFTHHVKSILPDPVRPGELHVAVEAGALLRSCNRVSFWLGQVKSAPLDTHWLVADPAEPKRLVSAAGDGFFESDDDGMTWRQSQDGLHDSYCWCAAISSSPARTVLISAASSALGAHYAKFANAAVYRREVGARWQRIENGLPKATGHRAAVIAAKKDKSGEFFLSTEGLVFVSADDGRQWNELTVEWLEARLEHAVDIAVV
jgi:photosystem II stability/assembly factor-like uncharacterized protein